MSDVKLTEEEYNRLLRDSRTLETLVKVLKRNGIDPIEILIKDTNDIINKVNETLKLPEKTVCIFSDEKENK